MAGASWKTNWSNLPPVALVCLTSDTGFVGVTPSVIRQLQAAQLAGIAVDNTARRCCCLLMLLLP